MVKYYGRARTQTGLSTDQKGFNMSGTTSSVGRSGALAGYVNSRVNSLAGVCGFPTQNGLSWRQSIKNKPPYCRQKASKCLAAAGGVGRKHNSYYKTPKSGVKGCGHRKMTCSRETKVLWNELEKELQLVGSLHKGDASIKDYKLILVGAGELVAKDMDIPKGSEVVTDHFIKFYYPEYADYPHRIQDDPNNLYYLTNPKIQSTLNYFNYLAYQLGALEVTKENDMEYHVVALCSIETIRALQTQEHKFGIPVMLGGCLAVRALAKAGTACNDGTNADCNECLADGGYWAPAEMGHEYGACYSKDGWGCFTCSVANFFAPGSRGGYCADACI